MKNSLPRRSAPRNDGLKSKLISLADTYEVSSFTDSDPSQFLLWYKNSQTDTELASFIAAMLSFGSRSQFIPKIDFILSTADTISQSISSWLTSDAYKKSFPKGDNKFYRFYSYDDLQTFFTELATLLSQSGSLGEYFKSEWEKAGSTTLLSDIISASFPKSRLVPKGRSSANKRIHMFLRWMVRTDSPVDLGLWTWYPAANLIIPLDVHVMQEAQQLGLLSPKATASRKTAIELTKQMEQIFPGDPCRADYALFGLGVDSTSSSS
ncbi:MAG: TIGR02757 family protein [Treponema sp.]|nr:TIGR02757 family protein [Treponema sp.]